MLHAAPLCVLLALVAGGGAVGAEAEVAVTGRPDRIYHAADAPIRATVTISHGGATPLDLQVVAWLEADLDRKTEPVVRQVEVSAGGQEQVVVHWPAAPLGLYGYAFHWRVERGDEVLHEGRDFFTVAQRYWDVALTASHPVAYSAQYSQTQVEEAVDRLREQYYNGFEKFFWAPDDFADMTPDREVYYSGQARYHESVANLQALIARAHEHGMRAITCGKSIGGGTTGAEMARAHPEMLYAEGGRLQLQARVRALHYWDRDVNWAGVEGHRWQATNWVFYNMNRPEVVDFGIDQIIASIEMFGWDGIRFDGHFVARQQWEDLEGQIHRLSPEEADAHTAANLARMKSRVWAVRPDFVFGYNFLNADAAADFARVPREFAEMCRDGGHIMNEYAGQAGDVNHPWNRWEDWAAGIANDAHMVRRLGGHYFPILSHYTGADAWHASAITYAAGAHPYYKHRWGAFATRYAGILWHRDHQRLLEPDGVVIGPAEVWWRPFVHWRQLDDERARLIVHLVTPPARERIQSRASKEVWPEPRRDLAVAVAPQGLPDGPWQVVGGVLLDPDAVGHEAVAAENVRGLATLRVPEVRLWKVLVVDLRRP